MRINKAGVLSGLIFCFLFICIFFPGDPFNLKLFFFFLACILGIKIYIYQIKNKGYSYLFFMGILYPAILMVWSFLLTGKVSSAITGAYPAVLILLVILIKEYDISYEKYMMFLLMLMAVATIFIVFLDIAGISSVNGSNVIRNAFYQYDMGLMGKSPAYAAYYKVFFKASPLLLILLPYCFEKNNYLMVLITFIALVLSGTRANIFAAAAIILFGCVNIWSENKKNYKLRVFLGIVITAVVLACVPVIFTVVLEMMNAEGAVSSDAVRSGQFISFMNEFSNPVKLLCGTGFGSEFYDMGRRAYSVASEMSYFDLLRKIGLVWFLPFMYFVVKPFGWKIGIHLKVAYLGYLLSAATNPLLFSSTAYVLFIYLYCCENYGYKKDRFSWEIIREEHRQ